MVNVSELVLRCVIQDRLNRLEMGLYKDLCVIIGHYITHGIL